MAAGTEVERAPGRSIAGRSQRLEAVAFGSLGVFAFSFSLPATRLALHGLTPAIVGLGRGVAAAFPAAIVLLILRPPRPRGQQWLRLAVTGAGVVVGLPALIALALQHVTAAHGAVVIGLLPAATAVFAVLRAGERPSVPFWVACGAGAACVMLFAWTQDGGRVSLWDGAALAAVILGGLGYAEGGALSRDLGGWQVICWALVLSAPLLVVPVAIALPDRGAVRPEAWFGFTYLSVVSMLLGFFAWYRGLALGGVARIGQLQLVQPLLTLAWSAALLGERVGPITVLAALGVIASVGVSQRAR